MSQKLVVMNKYEYAVWKAYSYIPSKLSKLVWNIRQLTAKIMRKVKNHPLLKTEYYLDYETNTVKVRKFTGNSGSYKHIQGKFVKVSQYVKPRMNAEHVVDTALELHKAEEAQNLEARVNAVKADAVNYQRRMY